MKKYFFYLRTMAVVAGLVFLLIHGGVVFGQEANNADLELRDQNLLKAGGKKKRFERRKGMVLENIGKRLALLNNFESCVKSANFREDLRSCRNTNKKGREALRAEIRGMREKMREKREKRREGRQWN
tara:strand:- start:139 stop:522 length:384 start_codon:yes stop_codon:yes gene_type:complete